MHSKGRSAGLTYEVLHLALHDRRILTLHIGVSVFLKQQPCKCPGARNGALPISGLQNEEFLKLPPLICYVHCYIFHLLSVKTEAL